MSESSARAAVARNAAALYVVQLVAYLIPILEIPILARALGPDLYGEILFCQALALTLSIFVEYGFNINSARQVALERDNPARLNYLFSNILLAKLLLAVPFVLVLLLAGLSGVAAGYFSTPALVWFVLAYFCAFGFSPIWYFQGKERLGGVAVLDVVLRMAGLGVLALCIRGPEDFLLALPILAIPPLLNTTLTTFWCRLEVGPVRWRLREAWRQVREGFHFFVYRSAGNLILAAAPMMLGMAAGKRAVGEFGPAEKLVRGMTSLATPFLTAAFPFFRAAWIRGMARFPYTGALRVLGVVALLALCGTAVGYALGGWALGLMLGDGFPGALAIYYLLIGLVPLRIMNQSIAMLLLIPAGHARAASYLLSMFSTLAICLGTLCAWYWGGRGMAAGLLAGELMLFLAQAIHAARIVRQGGARQA